MYPASVSKLFLKHQRRYITVWILNLWSYLEGQSWEASVGTWRRWCRSRWRRRRPADQRCSTRESQPAHLASPPGNTLQSRGYLSSNKIEDRKIHNWWPGFERPKYNELTQILRSFVPHLDDLPPVVHGVGPQVRDESSREQHVTWKPDVRWISSFKKTRSLLSYYCIVIETRQMQSFSSIGQFAEEFHGTATDSIIRSNRFHHQE